MILNLSRLHLHLRLYALHHHHVLLLLELLLLKLLLLEVIHLICSHWVQLLKIGCFIYGSLRVSFKVVTYLTLLILISRSLESFRWARRMSLSLLNVSWAHICAPYTIMILRKTLIAYLRSLRRSLLVLLSLLGP